MKIIKPIVGISKIIDNYDVVLCGLNGVLYNGESVNKEALEALYKASKAGKKVAILTNSALRVRKIAQILSEGNLSELAFLTSLVSAGEVLHYRLKNPESIGVSGTKYYNLGDASDKDIFAGLNYRKVAEMSQADFVFIGGVKTATDVIEDYMPALEQAVASNLPMICAGNDVSTYCNGPIALGCGAVAEQYAVMGGKIYTLGKPEIMFLKYVSEGISAADKSVLFIGDSFATDIKAAHLLEADTILISKGIHVNFLGEGYIPDVEKARNLATNFDVYPDYVASGLRW